MLSANIGKNKDSTQFLPVAFFEEHSEYSYNAYCPCCHERLQIVHHNNGVPHFFRHNKATPKTKECEKRVYLMGQSTGANNNYCPIESVVPLYFIKREMDIHFEVRFNPIPSELVPSDQSFVTIGSNKFLLSNINEWLIRRKIDEIPDCYENSYLDYSPDCTPQIKKINGSKVDSVECGWGFFNADSGKKVHRGGCLFYDQSYYLISKFDSNVPDSLKSIEICKYPNTEYAIYTVNFSSIEITESVKLFLEIEHLSLKDAKSHSILLWPPCTKQYGVLKPCKTDSEIILWSKSPKGSKSYSEIHNTDVQFITKDLMIYGAIKIPSIIEVEYDNYVEDFEFSPIKKEDLAQNVPMQIYFTDAHDHILDKFSNKTKCVRFNFDAVLEARTKTGICDYRHIKKGILENESGYVFIDIYSKYRFISTIQISTSRSKDFYVTRTDLLSFPRVKVPSNLDVLVLGCFSKNPLMARMIKQSCSDGTISKQFLEKILLSE